MAKTDYKEVDAAQDTNVKMSEVKAAWHQARNDAQRSGEVLEKRDLREKKDVSQKTATELKEIASRDQEPSNEQLKKWSSDQKEAKGNFESIRIAQRIAREEGNDYFSKDENKKAPQSQQAATSSRIQHSVSQQQASSGHKSEPEQKSERQEETKTNDQQQKR
jgi:glucan-binding YG repeat protein